MRESEKAERRRPGLPRRILARAMRKWRRFALHDPMAVAVKVMPSLFAFEKRHVTMETRREHTTGMTVTDRRDWLGEGKKLGPKVALCKNVSQRAFKRTLLQTLLSTLVPYNSSG